VHNLYGPTEATIAITSYEWTANSGSGAAVPIGRPFPGHEVAIVDTSGCTVGEGQRGELCLAGPQVTPGYWNDPERTAASFVVLPHSSDRWYRTGDLVEWSPSDGLIFHGRIDDQVQVMGFRVELAEVDAVLRAALHTESVITVSYPAGPAAEALYAFAVRDGDQGGEAAALATCREVLPPYMVPKQVFFIDHLPLNSNGKIDRAALSKTLEGRANE
jgi:acyl-CoA synthetase (AMP-forming)/AMP-acid ligase II